MGYPMKKVYFAVFLLLIGRQVDRHSFTFETPRALLVCYGLTKHKAIFHKQIIKQNTDILLDLTLQHPVFL